MRCPSHWWVFGAIIFTMEKSCIQLSAVSLRRARISGLWCVKILLTRRSPIRSFCHPLCCTLLCCVVCDYLFKFISSITLCHARTDHNTDLISSFRAQRRISLSSSTNQMTCLKGKKKKAAGLCCTEKKTGIKESIIWFATHAMNAFNSHDGDALFVRPQPNVRRDTYDQILKNVVAPQFRWKFPLLLESSHIGHPSRCVRILWSNIHVPA